MASIELILRGSCLVCLVVLVPLFSRLLSRGIDKYILEIFTRNEELRLLYVMVERLSKTLDMERLKGIVIDIFKDILGADEMVLVLEQAKMILEEDGKTNFVVSGHTDSTGTEEYNQGLSERCAASVKNWLVSNGVSAQRLKVTGYGETRAKYDNSTKEGRKLNRRVELQSQ